MGDKPPFFSHENSPEYQSGKRRRLPYAAVPLDPLHTEHPDFPGEEYLPASLRNIDQILQTNFKRALRTGALYGDSETLNKLYMMVQASLFYAQTERVNYHNRHRERGLELCDNPSKKVRAAMEGLATPGELLEILLEYPELDSIELAKQSRPFVYGSSAEMDYAIVDAIAPYQEYSVQTVNHVRAKKKGKNSNIPAAIVVRKRPIIAIDVGDEIIEITRRDGLVIRGDKAVRGTASAPLDRLIKNENRVDELTRLVVLTMAADEKPAWLVPLTTSYYAHRIAK